VRSLATTAFVSDGSSPRCWLDPEIQTTSTTSQLLLSITPQTVIIIIIIIIKKVKIIVTLSIKNTAGALYKSQIKGKNRYCLWLRNSNVFRRRRKQSSDGAALTSAGRLFHARDAATDRWRRMIVFKVKI